MKIFDVDDDDDGDDGDDDDKEDDFCAYFYYQMLFNLFLSLLFGVKRCTQKKHSFRGIKVVYIYTYCTW